MDPFQSSHGLQPLGCKILLAFVVIVITPVTTHPSHEPPYELQRGAVFICEGNIQLTDESWTLVFDVNVTEYICALDIILVDVRQIDTLIPTARTSISRYRVATEALQASKNLILARIYNVRKEIQEIEDSIEPYSEPKRSKRKLVNVAGSAIKFLFGNPDNQDLEELDVKLEGVSAQQEKIVIVLKAEATIINITFDLTQSNKRPITNRLGAAKELTEEFARLEITMKKRVDQLMIRLKILEYNICVRTPLRTLEAMLVTIENEVMQTTLGVKQAANHKLSLHFINAKEMLEILTNIQPHLQDGLGYVTSLHRQYVYKLYQVVHVRMATRKGILQTYAQIPLVLRDRNFHLYRVRPLQTRVGPEIFMFIQPDTPYLAITEDGLKFAEVQFE